MWELIKGHWVWIVGGAVVLGGLAFVLSRGKSGPTTQDLLVAPSAGSGPSAATGTTQQTDASGNINPSSMLSAISPVGPISQNYTPVTPTPYTIPTPVNTGGLATPNLITPINPSGATNSSQPISNSTPPFTGSPIPTTQSGQIALLRQAAATPTYKGTPLGPGTLVISGSQTAQPQSGIAPQTGMNQTLAAQNAKAGFGAGNPSMYG